MGVQWHGRMRQALGVCLAGLCLLVSQVAGAYGSPGGQQYTSLAMESARVAPVTTAALEALDEVELAIERHADGELSDEELRRLVERRLVDARQYVSFARDRILDDHLRQFLDRSRMQGRWAGLAEELLVDMERHIAMVEEMIEDTAHETTLYLSGREIEREVFAEMRFRRIGVMIEEQARGFGRQARIHEPGSVSRYLLSAGSHSGEALAHIIDGIADRLEDGESALAVTDAMEEALRGGYRDVARGRQALGDFGPELRAMADQARNPAATRRLVDEMLVAAERGIAIELETLRGVEAFLTEGRRTESLLALIDLAEAWFNTLGELENQRIESSMERADILNRMFEVE
ncbi:hypothetical protein J2T57_001407 [Natronocella acetinitrilica]|uniref:Uncharacterized protein n=1 Tax=Natronocella acetinitrilica TaxID=414046 RepID=A0AAE3G1W9_9GAMM|nr:hypothetical protein [Natronocella acetinitrilica]MCP1674305.1 hypothetical protein [Natronocella acetinitrilica]